MKNEKTKMHYAWKIVIACILMKLGTGGACAAAVGNFITPIVQDLGCKVSQLTCLPVFRLSLWHYCILLQHV